MDTKDLARATHDTVVAHVAEERETKAAIDELILLWRGSKFGVWIQDPDSGLRRAARGRDLGQGPFQVVMP